MSRKPASRAYQAVRKSSGSADQSFDTPDEFFEEAEKANRILKQKQKAMFASIIIKRDGKKQKEASVYAYMRLLNQQAACGEQNANDDLAYFQRHREKSESVRRQARARATSPIAPLYAKQERLAGVGQLVGGAIYLKLLPAVWRAFEVVKGPLTFSRSLIPPGLDPSIAAKKIESLLRRRQRAGPPSDRKVGRGRPPKEHQFAPGVSGNPHGRRPEAGVWDALQDGLLNTVWITRPDGTRERSTKVAVSIAQVFKKAMTGNRAAQRVLRREIVELDKAGLLIPSEKVKRCKGTKDPAASRVLGQVWRLAVPKMKQDLITLFARRFECTVPDFVTDLERSLGLDPEPAKSTTPLPPTRLRTSKQRQRAEENVDTASAIARKRTCGMAPSPQARSTSATKTSSPVRTLKPRNKRD